MFNGSVQVRSTPVSFRVSDGVILFILAPNIAPPNFAVSDWDSDFVKLVWDVISLNKGNIDGYKVCNVASFL